MPRIPVLLLSALLAGCAGAYDPGPPSLLGVMAPAGVCGVYPPGSPAWQNCISVGPPGPLPGQGSGDPNPAGFQPGPMQMPGMPIIPPPSMPSAINCHTTTSHTVDPNADSTTITSNSTCRG